MKLSVVIPVYNERATLPRVLTRVFRALPDVSKEIVIVDDGSTDGTREWLRETFGSTNPHVWFALTTDDRFVVVGDRATDAGDSGRALPHRHSQPPLQAVVLPPLPVRVLYHDRNRGKGAALRTGFAAATGDVLVVQDADLEYDPRDWARMWPLIAEGHADVVYGSRFYGEPHRTLYFHHYLGNKVISYLVNLLCDATLSDVETCYKMFRREVLDSITLTCDDFGFEVEFTVKVAKQKRWRIYELGIHYYGRTYEEGKKITWRDGVKALGYILKYRWGG